MHSYLFYSTIYRCFKSRGNNEKWLNWVSVHERMKTSCPLCSKKQDLSWNLSTWTLVGNDLRILPHDEFDLFTKVFHNFFSIIYNLHVYRRSLAGLYFISGYSTTLHCHKIQFIKIQIFSESQPFIPQINAWKMFISLVPNLKILAIFLNAKTNIENRKPKVTKFKINKATPDAEVQRHKYYNLY